MNDPYLRDFWIVSDKGRTLFPKLIRNQATGKARYQLLAKGSNRKEDGSETDSPVEAVRRFLAGESLRFGNESTVANRFELDGGHIHSFGVGVDFWNRNLR